MEHDYIIWSFEHGRWWAPERLGYTSKIERAGIYSFREALEICTNANIPEINEAMIPITEYVARMMQTRDDERSLTIILFYRTSEQLAPPHTSQKRRFDQSAHLTN